ncbi:hypothetical protein [Pseudoalteromonas luteoviolacea]|uniref:Uncharacterized protein n=1 Tax=Pseudoalteromonas luteoviolacea H33 TaxID=1365251 RepID=A0A167A803_9GAMM|nr:hypothetical protein [Pseudoalteromonas luteoviolacea]KZN45081.1 hypothetical protein N476_25855 [Pseudoalteromonas luteoviolacea H33]KZN79245.1 hypothetical protein N477_00160 [Pseudoalteromonas luteoviolacea H33-S]MBQ4877887.1 hypothetical protein [Pseudoalteromonas luteoviolacea]MBQ4906922.1 hypothetical protein [Pseudoalteromonas luteoviolacea]
MKLKLQKTKLKSLTNNEVSKEQTGAIAGGQYQVQYKTDPWLCKYSYPVCHTDGPHVSCYN